MGAPKHLLRFDDQTLIERTVARLRPLCRRIYLIGAGDVPVPLRRRPRIADRNGLAGPLAGITAAFDRCPRAAWLFVACDLPRLSAAALKWLIGKRRTGSIAVIPRLGADDLQPLLAIYEPSCRPWLEQLATRPRPGPIATPHAPGPIEIARLPDAACPRVPSRLAPAWTNVNTPADLRATIRTHHASGGPRRPRPRRAPTRPARTTEH